MASRAEFFPGPRASSQASGRFLSLVLVVLFECTAQCRKRRNFVVFLLPPLDYTKGKAKREGRIGIDISAADCKDGASNVSVSLALHALDEVLEFSPDRPSVRIDGPRKADHGVHRG